MKTIVIPSLNIVQWKDIREGLQNCIATVAPQARIYPRWPLKYDIGQTVALLKSKKDSGKVHAWIVGISRAESYESKAGGSYLEWDLNVRIWGFLGYEQGVDDDNTQNILEEEARRVAEVIFLNREHLSLDIVPNTFEVGYVVFDDIDVHGFSGNDVHVAQGNLAIRIGGAVTVAP